VLIHDIYTFSKIGGLVCGFLGSILLLEEPVRLRLKNGNVEVDTNIESYNNRLHKRRLGIVLLATSFIFQMFA